MKEEITTEDTNHTEEQVRTASDSDRVPGIEALAAENEALKAEIRMRSAVSDIETRLTQAGARSPGLLVERAKESFQFSDAGDLVNGEAVVDHLRRTYPEQFAPASNRRLSRPHSASNLNQRSPRPHDPGRDPAARLERGAFRTSREIAADRRR